MENLLAQDQKVYGVVNEIYFYSVDNSITDAKCKGTKDAKSSNAAKKSTEAKAKASDAAKKG